MAWPIVGTMDNGDDVDDFRPISNYFKQSFVCQRPAGNAQSYLSSSAGYFCLSKSNLPIVMFIGSFIPLPPFLLNISLLIM